MNLAALKSLQLSVQEVVGTSFHLSASDLCSVKRSAESHHPALALSQGEMDVSSGLLARSVGQSKADPTQLRRPQQGPSFEVALVISFRRAG